MRLENSQKKSTGTQMFFRLAVELGVAFIASVSVVALSLWRSGIALIDLSKPLAYNGDSLTIASSVFAAQLGSPFRLESLGAPNGQALGFSAYGAQWMQSSWAAALSLGNQNPWLASNLYMIYSIFIIVFSVYVAMRLMGVTMLPAAAAAAALGSLRGIFAWAGFPFLQNYAGLFLFTAMAIRLIISDKNHISLLPEGFRHSPKWVSRILSVSLVGFAMAVSATGDNYYMWFGLIVLGFSFIVSMVKSGFRLDKRSRVIFWVGTSQAFVIFVALAPIVFSRIFSGLPLREASLSDRRPFAALATGGEITGLLLPENNTFLMTLLREITVVNNFILEYESSSIILSEDYKAGSAPMLLVGVLLTIFYFHFKERKDFKVLMDHKRFTLKIVLVFLAFSIFLYVRGGGGLIISFIFPFLRGFDRAIVLVSFLSVLAIAIIASRKFEFTTKVQSTALLALLIIVLDNFSGIQLRDQDLARTDLGDFKGASISDIEALTEQAERSFAEECSVLVLPVTTYPVDFPATIVSYLTYETLKPGLVTSDISWTSGAIPDTPGSHPNARFRELFLARDYERLQIESKELGSCGVVMFSGLQDAIAQANPAEFDASKIVRDRFSIRYPDICFEEKETGIVLMCNQQKE